MAFSTSKTETFGPLSGAFMMNAISASMRGWMKRSPGTVAPSSNIMSSNSTPESGMSMLSAYCIALDVRPIFQPITLRPSAIFFFTQADCTA
ncbi:hypothetical protein D3C76_1764200 [compost metagenome]